MPDLFVPNELETHLIVKHKVLPRMIAFYRRDCKERGVGYDHFLETNHRMLHFARGDTVEHEHDEDYPTD